MSASVGQCQLCGSELFVGGVMHTCTPPPADRAGGETEPLRCGAKKDLYGCTLLPGHGGDHEAWATDMLCRKWTNAPSERGEPTRFKAMLRRVYAGDNSIPESVTLKSAEESIAAALAAARPAAPDRQQAGTPCECCGNCGADVSGDVPLCDRCAREIGQRLHAEKRESKP